MKKIKLILGICFVVFYAAKYNSQAASSASKLNYSKSVENPESLFTGTTNVSIPLVSCKDGNLSIPIYLSYNTGGNRVADLAGPVGLGWALMAGGAVSRTIRGLEDDDQSIGYWYRGASLNTSTHVDSVGDGLLDGEPDIFYVSSPGLALKFYFDKDHVVHTIPSSNVKVEPSFYTNGVMIGFTITSGTGVKYYYGYSYQSWQATSYNDFVKSVEFNKIDNNTFSSSWNLERIETFDSKQFIDFEYERDYYKFKVLSECQFSAAKSGSTTIYNGESACVVSETDVHVEGSRLTKIISPTKEVDLVYSSRTDLLANDDFLGTTPQKLDKMRVETGSYCYDIIFDSDYFIDNSRSDNLGKRLRLDKVQKKDCTNVLAEEPYTLEYYSPSFFPNYLSKRIDHWGYYNAASANDSKSNLIPNDCYNNICYGDALRYSLKSAMEIGALKKIVFPTKGSTTFEYEANEYIDFSNYNINLFEDYSCGGASTCCFNQEEDNTFTLTQQMIESGVITLSIEDYDTVDDPCYTNFSNDAYLYIYDQNNGGALVYDINFDTDLKFDEIEIDVNSIDGLVAGGSYKFRVASYFSRAHVVYKYNTSYSNTKCGGLRISKVTTHDGQSVLNDIIRTYNYQNHSDASKSSGKISKYPIYAHYAGSINLNSTVIFKSYSVVPFSNLEGHHVGYENVTVDYNGNGKSKYVYNIGFQPAKYEGYPTVPKHFKSTHGALMNESNIDDNSVEISTKVIQGSSSNIAYGSGITIKAEKLKFFNGSTWVDQYRDKNYNNATSYYKLSQTDETLDGFENKTTYEYQNPGQLSPSKITYEDSDGVTYYTNIGLTGNYFSYKYRLVFIHYNMVDVPYKTITYKNSTALAGHETNYSNYTTAGIRTSSKSTSYFIRPYYEESIERTITNGIPTGSTWSINKYYSQYNSDGLIFKTQNEGWTDYDEFYYNNDKLLTKHKFKNHEKIYSYISNTSLLSTQTNVDGTTMSYTYDDLLRTKTVKDDCNNIETTYGYFYDDNGSNPYNYISTLVDYPTASNSDLDNLESRIYLDGLGRKIQTNRIAQSTNNKDLVLSTSYDNQGRVKYSYHQKETDYSDGRYVLPVPTTWDKNEFEYYSDPIGRIKRTKSQQWYWTNYEYSTNSLSDAVKLNGTTTNYAANSLLKKITTDGSGKKQISFSDKRGRNVLNRKTDSNDNSSKRLDTYTLYDAFNRVSYVLPPGVLNTSSTYDELLYKYEYDREGKMVYKKMPGADPVSYMYDDRDLLVAYQDGNLSDVNQWYTYTHDNYGRILKEGLFSGTPTTTFTPTDLLKETTWGSNAYDKDKVSNVSTRILGTSNFLDRSITYNSCGVVTSESGNNHNNLTAGSTSSSYLYDGSIELTKTTSNVNAFSNPKTLISTYEIDHAGRNYINKFKVDIGGVETVLNYNEFDEKEQLVSYFQGSTGLSGTLEYLQKIDYAYMPNGLLEGMNIVGMIGSEQSLDTCGDPSPSSPSSNYDERDLFRYELSYDSPLSYTHADTEKNGNIVNIIFQVRGRDEGVFSYKYDDYDRLLEAKYYDRQNGVVTSSDRYTSIFGYDERGRFTSILRQGMYSNNGCYSIGQIDFLTHLYKPNSNQIDQIVDTATGSAGSEGFKDGLSGSYQYDSNGNLIEDRDREITIDYNHLDLPNRIDFTGTSKYIEFLYDANGTKLRKSVYDGSTLLETRDYIGQIEYLDGVIESIYHSEGRVRYVNGSNPKYEYAIKDHLGNTRLTYIDENSDGKISTPSEITWEGHYYPFGMEMKGDWMNANEPEINYKYNGIEKVEDHGLYVNMAFYRTLDPASGTWWSVDPYAENFASMSPYVSMGNNPISYTDPEGGWIHIAIGAVVGAGINVYTHWDEINGNGWNWGEFGKAVAIGGGAGAVTAATGGLAAGAATIGGGIAIGAGSAIGGDLILQGGNHLAFGDEYNWKQTAVAGGLGAVGGGLTQYFSRGSLPGIANNPGDELIQDGLINASIKTGNPVAQLPDGTIMQQLDNGSWVKYVPSSGSNILPRGVVAQWGKVFNYRHGGNMSAIEHISYRHAFNSGFEGVSKFSQNTSASMIKNYVDQAVKYGTPINGGFEFSFGKAIGTGIDGKAANSIRVFVRDGWVRTAFPFN